MIMLLEKELDVKSAPNKLAAVLDAKRRSDESKLLYDTAQIGVAEEFYAVVQSAFFRSKVYLTYRDSFVSIKIDKPMHADKISISAKTVDDLAGSLKCEKVLTAQGIIYRIPR